MDRPSDWADLGDEHAIDEQLTRCSVSPERAVDPGAADNVGGSRDAADAGGMREAAFRAALGRVQALDSESTGPSGVKAEPAVAEPAEAEPAEAEAEPEVKMEDILKDRIKKTSRDSATPLREIGVDTPEPDDRQCRICLGGVEDEVDMGRLISPCLCTGSMRYVHINCINEWRGTGANAKSFMECPQCSYEYSIRRTAVVGLATSRPLLLLLTSLLFLATTLAAGHMLFKYLVALVDEEIRQEAKAKTAPKATYYDDADDTYIWESNVVFLGGATMIYEVTTQAVHTFVIFAGDVYDMFANDDGWISTVFVGIVVRLILGLSILGSFSGLTLLASLSLFAPLQVIYALKATGMFNGIRRRLASVNSTYVIVAFVVIGIFNSIVQVYDLVHSITSKILRYVETQIVEVHSPEARQLRGTGRAGWWHRWWAERRWRTAGGWSEVRLRAWIGFKEWVRRRKAAAAAVMHGHQGAVDVAG